MPRTTNRRGFLQQVGSDALVAGIASASAQKLHALQRLPLSDAPAVDGSLVYEDAALNLAAIDSGDMVKRRPRAVLKPASIQDVARIVRYAYTNRIPVVMRGRGHSHYGQALVKDGIVIDSQSLDKVHGTAKSIMDVEAGASLAQLIYAALAGGFAFPVMTDCIMLSVGGFLSVGGQSIGSQRFGAFVDQAVELEVVTGDGRIVTCSETQERELFEMMLAGLGQCGIIVRAKLRLIPAPLQVTLKRLTYDALEPFLSDQERLVSEGRLHLLEGGIRHKANRGWEYHTTVGMFGVSDSDIDTLDVVGATPHASISQPFRRAYPTIFLNRPSRNTPVLAPSLGTGPQVSNAPARVRRVVARPSLAVWLPASAARNLIEQFLASSEDTAGITSIECTGLATARFHRPLFRVPAEERMFAFWALRSVFADSEASLDSQLAGNRRFLERAIPAGAKRYPPYDGSAGPVEWRAHYGEEIYSRFAAAKRKYDEHRILTPGPGIFD